MKKCIALLLVVTLTATLASPALAALPHGGQVQSGAAAWEYNGDVLEVEQTTNRVVIDWQRFSIGEGNTVVFHQPGADAAALNRVIGDDPSTILGTLAANGQVFLVNPHGVIFGPDAMVDVGSLVASALWMDVDVGDNKTFWDEDSAIGLWEDGGRVVFEQRDGDGPVDVLNMGRITADGDNGYIVLLGPALVRNEGSLSVLPVFGDYSHRVGLVAGGRVQLTDAVVPDTTNAWDEDQWTAQTRRFVVDEATAEALVETAVGSLIDVTGGADNVVFLAAASAKELHQAVINQQGEVMARRMEVIGGPNGTVKLGGAYSEASNWNFTMYAEGERIVVANDEPGPVRISRGGGQNDVVVFNADKEIVVDSDIAYRNHLSLPGYWSFFAPTVSFQGDVMPYDEQSQPLHRAPSVYIKNNGSEPLTVTSEQGTTLTFSGLQIDVSDGTVVDMRGALNIGDGTYLRGFGSPDALRLSNPQNRLGNWVQLDMDWTMADGGGARTLTADDIVIRASDDRLAITGDFHATGDILLWNDGGDVVLSNHLVRLAADGELIIAATGGGVFINEAGRDVFGEGGPQNGRVRIYSSSPTGGYNAGGLESWEYGTDVEFMDDPVGDGHVIYFLDEAGALIVIVEIILPNDGTVRYGELAPDTAFGIKYYLKADPSTVIDPDKVEQLQLRIVDEDGREYMPSEWGSLSVGTYELVGHGGRSGQYRLEYVPTNLQVRPAPLTLTISGGVARDYGDDNSVLDFVDVQFSGWARPDDDRNWLIGRDVILSSVGRDAPVGTYDITLSGFQGDLAHRLRNYDLTTIIADDAVLQVRPRPITVEVGEFTRWYGDENDFTGAAFRLGASGRGLALDHTLADLGFGGDPNKFLISNAVPRSLPGTYTVGINPSGLSAIASNYDVTVIGNLVVTKRPVTVWAGSYTTTYLDAISLPLDNIVTSDLGQGGNLLLPQRQVVGVGARPTVGDYVVTWDIPEEGWDDARYDLRFEDGILTVVPRPIVVEIGDITRQYGDEIRAGDYKVTISNIPDHVSWAAPRVTMELWGASARSDVGFYEGAVGGVVDDPNFAPTIVPGNLTITPRPIVLYSYGGRTYGDHPEPVRLSISTLAEWHDVDDVLADVVLHSEGTQRQAQAGTYRTFIKNFRLINDNYVVEDVMEGYYEVQKRDLWVAVGDIAYPADERKPYPQVRFDNLAPWDSSGDMMRQGCLTWLPNPFGVCTVDQYDGDMTDPYFLFDRAQQGRYRHGLWGRADDYIGPWQWFFHRNSDALRNYRIVESRLGHEIILPALSREEMIDIVLNDRPRDQVFAPETSFEPPEQPRNDGEWSETIVFRRHDVEFSTEIVQESEVWVDGRRIPRSCLLHTDAAFQFMVYEHCVRANEALDGITAGLPDESQEIVLSALANWLATTRDGLTATTLAGAYEALKGGDNYVIEHVFPFLLAEFYNILDKDEADLTPGERAYVEHVAETAWRERKMSADRALEAYNAWVEGNDKRYEDAPNLGALFTFGQGMPDYLKSAAMEAELGIPTQGGLHSRKTEMIVGLGSLGSTIIGGGGALLGSLGVLEPLVSTVFPFAARAGQAAVTLSGISLGTAVLGSVAFVATIVSSVVVELVERENVRRKIDAAVEKANGPPPTFAELKAMRESEQGELQLMMHVMSAFDQYAPGGSLDQIARGWPATQYDIKYMEY